MSSRLVWALVGVAVLALSGGAAASTGKSGRSSGHAPPASKILHPPLPPALLRALTRPHLKAKKTSAVRGHAGVHRVATGRGRGAMAASTPSDLAAALAGGAFVQSGSASFVTAPTNGTPDAVSDVGFTPPAFPVDGGTFAILTNGDATQASAANDSPSLGTDDSCTPGAGCGSDGDPTSKGANRQNAHDVTILKIPLVVPRDGSNCLSFDFRYLSEEYPEFVSSPYNDAFVAELDKSTWTATGKSVDAPISAPNNFAADVSGKPISVNASLSAQVTPGAAQGTTYDGATPLLRASTPITAGSHTLYLSIFDQGDHVYDSAAFVDNLRLTTTPGGRCAAGAVVDELPADISVGTKASVSSTTANIFVTVHNDGPAAARSVQLTENLLNGYTFTGADGADCTGSDTQVSCTVGDLPAGASTIVVVHANVDNTAWGLITQSSVTGSTFDPVQGNNQSFTYDETTMPPASATSDLGVSVVPEDGPTSYLQGALQTYTVTIANNGPDTFTGLLETSTYIPKGVSFIGWSLPDGEAMPDAFDGCYAIVDGEMSCDFEPGFSLPNAGVFHIELYGYVLRTGWLTAETDLFSSADDPNYSNNYALTSIEAAPTVYQTANVSLQQTVDKDFVKSGDPLTYTIQVTNNGPNVAQNVEVVDPQPLAATGQSVSDTAGNCSSLVAGGVDCTFDLQPGATDTITYTVTATGANDDFIFNVATASPGTFFDPSLADNYWYAYAVIEPDPPEHADLSVKLSLPKSASAGSPLTLAATVMNRGPSGLQDAWVDLSAYMLESGKIVTAPAGCSFDEWGNYGCDLGALAKGASKTVKLTVVPAIGGDDFVSADVYSPDPTWEDANYDNNYAQARLFVSQPIADLGLSVLDAVDPLPNGSNETYTLIVSNPSGDPAANVQVIDTLPDGVTLVSASGKGFTCTQAAVVTCTLKGALGGGKTATVTLVVSVNLASPGALVDTASVSSAAVDPDPSDNSASVQTQVTSPA